MSPAHATSRKAACSSGPRSSAACTTSSARRSRSTSGVPLILLSLRAFSVQFPVEPQLSGLPFAHHRLVGDAEHGGGFFHAQAAEEAQLYHLTLAREDLRERSQR